MKSKKQNINRGSIGYQADNININNFYDVIRNPSVLAKIVNAISKIDLEDEINFGEIKEAPVIEDKIKHNNIKAYQYLITGYKIYGKVLEKIYKTLEQENPGKKSKLLRIISDFYKAEKGRLTSINDIEIIRSNADKIIEKIINKLNVDILKSLNLNADNEDIKIAISIIVADAFIRCKILENPNKQ
ncbi:MAG: hypothetical protein B6D64_05430 [Bacteroidetes bacterium 4484_276]|nr:MAG: hypothetical protein B6D64_05430 [Bacteroidetes bacterium 4484_276]